MQTGTNQQKSIARIVKNLPLFQSNFTNWHEEINATTEYMECNIIDAPKINSLRKEYGCENNFGENKTYSCKNLKKQPVNILDDHHMMIKAKSQRILNTANEPSMSNMSSMSTMPSIPDTKKTYNRDEYMMYNEIVGSCKDPKTISSGVKDTTTIKVHEFARSESVDAITIKPSVESEFKMESTSIPNQTTDTTSVTIIANRYLIGDLISSGSYSNVFKCIDMHTAKKCVIKEFLDNDYNFRTETIRELTVLSTLRNSPHIVGVHSIISAIDTGDLSTRFYAVLNYHTKTLHDFIYENVDFPIIRRDLGEIFCRDIARGLAYMHSCGIAHCDLKPANVLITSTHNAVIADFSLALFVGHQHTKYNVLGDNPKSKCYDCETRELQSQMQTLGYRAPEILFEKENYDGFAADVWSFGCVAAEIYYGYPLFYAYGNGLDYLKSVIRELGPIDTNLDYMKMYDDFEDCDVCEPNNESNNESGENTKHQPITSPILNNSSHVGDANANQKPKRTVSTNKYTLIMETKDYYENYKFAMDSLKFDVSKENIPETQKRTKVSRPRVPKIADSDLRNVIEECLSYNPSSRPLMMVIASYFEACYGRNYIAGKNHPLDSIDFNTKVPKTISRRMACDTKDLTVSAAKQHKEVWEYFIKTSPRERHVDWLINICAGAFRKECIYTIMRIYDMFFKEITKFIDIRVHPIRIPSIGSFSRGELYEYARLSAYAIGCVLYEDLEIECAGLAGDMLDKFILAKFMIFMTTTLKFDFGICERIFMDVANGNNDEYFTKFAKTKENLLNHVGYSVYDSAILYL